MILTLLVKNKNIIGYIIYYKPGLKYYYYFRYVLISITVYSKKIKT